MFLAMITRLFLPGLSIYNSLYLVLNINPVKQNICPIRIRIKNVRRPRERISYFLPAFESVLNHWKYTIA